MSISRRDVLAQTARGLTGLFAFGSSAIAQILTPRQLQVRFVCKVDHHHGAPHFEKKRAEFERRELIETTNAQFQRDGRIVKFDFHSDESSLTWTYVFRSKSDYKAWNQIVYHGGLFSRRSMPSEFKMEIHKTYV